MAVRLYVAVAIIFGAVFLWPPRPADPLPGFPNVFVWAWERPENLDFLNPQATGVAFLARTITLQNGSVSVRPRLQPLRYPPGAVLISVVRVEAHAQDSKLPPVADVAEAVSQAAAISGVRGLQIDFDATLSQRAFYRELLTDIRRRVPPSMPISMTALTSWCESDSWIVGLPVVEAVPMLFRMGPGERPARTFRPQLCQSSAGVSVDEVLREPPLAPRLYIFNPQPWTATSYQAALREVRKWH
ncbi:MAG: DUF3142 domain-containing protein [Acidobacteriota bacterium]